MEKLTNSQKSIWVTEQYYKGTSVNSICGTAIIEEQINIAMLKKAVEIVCKKHDNFKLQFKVEDGKVKQEVLEKNEPQIEDISVENEEQLKKETEKIVRTSFKLEQSYLYKFYIFKFKDGKGGFMLNIHHIIADAWTLAFICNEIIEIYSKIKKNESIETKAIYSYLEYINSEQQYLNSEKYQKDKLYWQDKFVEIPELATIPGSKQNRDENNPPTGERIQFNLDSTKVEKIKQYCKENKISLYNFFMAIYAIYIGEISNLDEFVIGTPILNRTNFKEKNTTGMFVNMIPFKINMNQNEEFKTFIKRIALDSIGMLKHQKYSYQCLLENLREKNKNIPNLYNILLSYQITNAHQEGGNMPYKTEWTFNGCCAENMDIQLFDINDTGSLNIAYDYKTSIYEKQDIENLHKRILNIIEQVIIKDNIYIKDIDIVTPEEKENLIMKFNETKLNYDSNIPIIKYFEEQVNKTPNNIAIVFENKQMTYKELNEKANSLAHELRKNGVTNNTIVGIMQERSFEMIIAILAVLKSGGAYIPIATDYPTDRIQYMLEDSNASILLAETNQIKTDKKIISINLNSKIYDENKENIENISNPEDLSYLIYTSGSTGTPKGVMLKQKNLTNFYNAMLQNIEYLTLKKSIKIISITTVSFDIFIFETLISLTKGLQLYMTNEEEQKVTEKLETKIKENEIQAIQTTPSVMRFHLNNLKNLDNLKSLKYIMLAGEPLPKTLVNHIKELIPGVVIYNGYGPSETTIFSTTKDVTNLDEITIGKPIANTQIYILNKNKKILPQGNIGEMYISGDGVGKGYMNKKEQTENNFIPNPFNENNIMYKTGDLGSFKKDGEILCYGRVDNQIKIRGLRVELSEIEKQISQIPNIKNCIVVKKQIEGRDALCAYYTQNKPVEEKTIKAILQSKLPQYMVPQYFTKLKEMPFTPNGKIDKKSLPLPELQKESSPKVVKPRNEIDRQLIEITEKILNIQNVSITDTLIDLGGDSLTVITLLTQIQSKFNVQIFIKDVMANKTIEEISNLIKESIKENNTSIVRHVDLKEYYPLLPGQIRVYYSSIVDNNSVLYNIPGALEIDGLLDSKKLERCLCKIIDRHESLRTYFVIQDKHIAQKIEKHIDFRLDILKNSDYEDFDKILKDFVKPFNLYEAPLFRVKYVEFTNQKSAILLDIHHIIADGRSMMILINEICELYNNTKSILPELQYTYKDFLTLSENKIFCDKYNEAKEYWLKQFKGELPVLNMPTNNLRPPIQSYEGSRVYKIIDNSIYNSILKISKKLNVTPYMILLCAYYILLEKYTGQEDIIVGTPCLGREIEESKDIIGMFVNTLPLRNKVNPNYTVLEFLKNIRENVIKSFNYQIYPFNDLVDELKIKKDPSRNSIFDTMFIYQNDGYKNISLDNFKTKYCIPDAGISKFDLSVEAVPLDEEVKLTFEYSTKLFETNFIIDLSENYINILNSIINNINIQISEIDILSKDMKQKILFDFNNTKKYYKEKTFATIFEEQVEKTPNKIALVFEDKKLTYRELNEKANSLAYYLRNTQKIKRESIVGIMVNRSLEMIVGILGIIKAGGTYIPIDPNFPQNRINYMLESSSASVLLVNKKIENKIDYKNKVTIDLNNEDIYDLPNNNLPNENKLSDLLYIIFTSGSTGKPKGVMQTHRTLVNFINYCNDYVGYLKEPENQTIVSISTMSFDIFSYEALIPLQKGLTVVIANENEQITPQLLNELMLKNNVTVTQATPSVMQIFVNNINNIPYLKKLKYLTLTGEQVPISLVKKLKELGNITIYDGYGPTETYYCTLTEIKNDFVTIGKPFYNNEIYILDKNLKPVPIGVIGEIYISGDGLARGYLNNPELTEKSFIKNPFIKNKLMYKSGDLGKYLGDGNIICLGRIDNQIKIRGLRIELEEIEKVISQYPNIEKVAVLKQSLNDRDFISAYFVANKRIAINELRKFLAKSLPKYMIPSYYIPLDEFIYTPNGKIDRKKLPLPEKLSNLRNEEYVAPSTELQRKLVQIFENILNIKPIGINDNFFELGGDSLLAMKLNIELLNITNKISYSDIFKYSTVCEIEEKINSDERKNMHNNIEKLSNETLEILEKTKEKSIIKEYHPKNIILTGATGFLGVHTLEEFLNNEQGKIYCIIRKEPGLSITRKITQKLTYYFGEKYNDLINKRIIPIEGDICKPQFGLKQDEILKISNDIDLVINCAANASHFGKYDDFYNSNVKSVKYIVDFCKIFNKRLYHISTTGIAGKMLEQNYEEKEFSESSLYIGQYLDSVYSYTKFEAETVVLNAIANHVDAYILRLGNLMPRLRDGVFQENIQENAFVNKFADFMKLSIIPDYLLENRIEFTPIDLAAQAIYKIVTNYSNQNRIFHIYNHNTITIAEYAKFIKDFGYNMKVVSKESFKENILKILQNEDKKTYIQNIASNFDDNYNLNYNKDTVLNSDFTIEYLKECEFNWPKISKKYLINFIDLIRRRMQI